MSGHHRTRPRMTHSFPTRRSSTLHHQRRQEVARRGHRQAQRARPRAAHEGLRAMPATPKKGRRFGGSSQHQRLMMANLVASLVAAEGIVTTEAKDRKSTRLNSSH